MLARLKLKPSRCVKGVLILLLSAGCITGLLASCAPAGDITNATHGQIIPFADYQREVNKQLSSRRNFQTEDPVAELAWNGPGEWRPATDTDTSPGKGILLVHGLSDSPWSFFDLAPELAARGFLVRTVLLPGHGTHPEDLIDVNLDQWRRVVKAQVLAMQQDVVGEVYLGGFSTGANLVLEVAYADPDIAGLLLISPGFRSDTAFDWLAPLIAKVRSWVIQPSESIPMQNAVRYLNTPANGFAQYYYSSKASQRLLSEHPYNKPVFMAVAQHDSVLDTPYLLNTFRQRFTHPASRLVWYGSPPKDLYDEPRVLVRTDSLPQQRISQFSHMGLLFSPNNPLYGAQGSLRICLNGLDEEITQACERNREVWYSAWGYQEDGKIHARLTFNPYFDWQTSVIASVLD